MVYGNDWTSKSVYKWAILSRLKSFLFVLYAFLTLFTLNKVIVVGHIEIGLDHSFVKHG